MVAGNLGYNPTVASKCREKQLRGITMVNEITAFGFSDNYRIEREGIVVAVEHNQTEANALCAFLNGRNGGGYSVSRNSREQVREGRKLCPTPHRHPLRDEAFEAMGIV